MSIKRNGRNRGQIIPKGDGKWLVRVYVGKDGEGKRKYVAETVEGTFKVADKLLTEKTRALDTQSFVAPTKTTVKEYLTTWLAAKSISVKTRLDYEHRLAKDVYPEIGGVKLTDLSPMRVRTLYGWLSNTRKLSPRTVQYTHSILNQALEQAVTFGVLSKNPCAYQELPKAAQKEDYTILTPEQASLFLEKTTGDKHHTLWLTLLTTGLRPQEVLALEWKHFDGPGKTLHVEQALNAIEKGHYVVGPVKTVTSRRFVSLPETTVRALNEHRRSTGRLSGFIFPGRSSFLDMSAVRIQWKAALERAGCPAVKLHGARHTHASHLLAAGEHPKVAQERLGHSKIGTTMDTYSHVMKETHQKAASMVEALLFTPKLVREA